MRNNINIINNIYNIFLIFLILVATISYNGNAIAQTPIPENCATIAVSHLTIPFRVRIDHDPAVKKVITSTHDNPSSALTTEGTEPTKAISQFDPKTHLAFSSNDTDNWGIQVELDHNDGKTGTRTLKVDFYEMQSQSLAVSDTILYAGNHFCGVFRITSIIPVHILTNQEILTIAQKIQEEKLQQHDQYIAQYASQATASANTSGFLAIVVIIIGVISIQMNRAENRKAKEREDEYKIAKENFENGLIFVKTRSDYQNMLNEDQRQEIASQYSKMGKIMIDAITTAQNLIYKSMADFMTVVQLESEKLGIKSNIEIPSPPPEIKLPEPEVLPIKFVEDPTEISSEGDEETTKEKGAISKLWNRGKEIIFDKDDKTKPDTPKENTAEYWYNEFRSGLDENGKYNGKLQEIWEDNYPEAFMYPTSISRAKIEAINRIVEEEGKWV